MAITNESTKLTRACLHALSQRITSESFLSVTVHYFVHLLLYYMLCLGNSKFVRHIVCLFCVGANTISTVTHAVSIDHFLVSFRHLKKINIRFFLVSSIFKSTYFYFPIHLVQCSILNCSCFLWIILSPQKSYIILCLVTVAWKLHGNEKRSLNIEYLITKSIEYFIFSLLSYHK